ncbi:phosphate-starvation-inducible PsiE family protein [Paraburkholderia sp. MMS20-SJTR3]|uniref:Phosphate-starvation-inducible PsiE family protein n=1 Tax=Paraburkholderia sejongensis TaxID=2886946 RepID=A0ABS8K608_9BURK|nr:phosphate-starvation-inducible PsiE family protein [Paraburkholderia sp. MMS20-SJTR3]MCC8397604.1 phosphate-starvation-inducible PsiE family protein [Paraburkholderia sp. MMS20-SJTR3]
MERKKSWLRKDLDALRLQWDMLTFYERFEQLVAHVLSFVISIIILVSLWQLIRAVISLLLADALNPLDHAVYQTIFGMVMTLLIAMEFKHSITRVMARRDHIVQVKTVLLVALLAIARKFIILDPASAPAQIAALAFALVALGTVYWLMRQRDDPVDATIAAQAERDRVVHAQRQQGGPPREGGQSDN